MSIGNDSTRIHVGGDRLDARGLDNLAKETSEERQDWWRKHYADLEAQIAEQARRAEQAEAALAIEREKHDEEAYDDMQAVVAECLDEIRRLRAETTRLKTVIHSTRPEIAALRRVAVLVSDLLVNLPMRLDTIQDDLRALLPPEDADLPTLGELRGCLSDGRARVEAALEATTQEITEREKHDNEVGLRAERQRPS